MSALTSLEQAFLIKEYSALRSEVLQTLKEARDVERNVVAAVAIVLVWLGKDIRAAKFGQQYWIVWWIPLSLVVLGIARSAAILRLFGILSEYISSIEAAFLSATTIEGWEHYSKPRKSFISGTGILLWALLLAGTFCIAIYHP